MALSSISRNWRHMHRYRQILSILLKYGFGDIVDVTRRDLIGRFGDKIIPLLGKHIDSSMSRAERLRRAAEELGPTFIKLAQVLSTRPDLVPHDVATELQKLQDEVAPFPYEEIRQRAAAGVRFMVTEDNMGQMIDDVKLAVDGKAPVFFAGMLLRHLPSGMGLIFPERLFTEVKKHYGT